MSESQCGRCLIGVSRYESDIIAKRSLGGGWKAPDGYRNKEERIPRSDRDGKGGKYRHWIELDSEQSKVWKEAFEMLLKGMKCKHICDALHQKGYRLCTSTPFVQVRADGSVLRATSTLSQVFHNPFYAGLIYVRNHFDDKEIPDELFVVRGD